MERTHTHHYVLNISTFSKGQSKPVFDEKRIRSQYPAYVMQKDMMKICGISEKKASELNRNGEIPYTPIIYKKLHYNRIRLDDIIAYLYRRYPSELTGYTESFHCILHVLLNDVPDLIDKKQASRIIGCEHTQLDNLIRDGALSVIHSTRKTYINKETLILYLASPSYRLSKGLSLQKQAILMTAEWHYQVSRFPGKENA
jgi:hypothetical protein